MVGHRGSVPVHRAVILGITSDPASLYALGLDCGDLVEVNVGLVITPTTVEQITNLGHRAIPLDRGDLINLQMDRDSGSSFTGTSQGAVSLRLPNDQLRARRQYELLRPFRLKRLIESDL